METFGERLRKLRREKRMSQTDLGRYVGVDLRTVRGWEMEGRSPRRQEIYTRLAEVLGCPVAYLLEGKTAEKTGTLVQAKKILEQAQALFAGGGLSDEDQIAFLNEIQSLYLDSKRRAKKFTPKKYRNTNKENEPGR